MVYVIRHGQVKSNVHGLINGWNELELNEVGREQARKAGEELKSLQIDEIYCSPLLRTRQTLELLGLDGIPVHYDQRLIERNAGSLVDKPFNSVDDSIWYDPTRSVVYGDSEGFKSIIDRVTSLLDEIKSNKNILLVTHGDVCQAINLYFDQNYDYLNEYQKNCEIRKHNYLLPRR